MSALSKTYYTPAEYLEWERSAAFKSEYLNGQMWPLHEGPMPLPVIAGAREKIAANLIRLTLGASGERMADVRVDEEVDVRRNPRVLIKVLSPTTENDDRSSQWANCQQIASLTTYVLVSQTEPRIESYARQDGGAWLYSQASGLESVLSLPSLDCTLPLREIYDRITFDLTPTSPEENFR